MNTIMQAKTEAALNQLTAGQEWLLSGQRHLIVNFNRREGLAKTWNFTRNCRDSVCVVWLVEKGVKL